MKKQFYLLNTAIAMLLSISAFAQPAGWSKVKLLRVSNSSTTTITNYQLKLIINTQSLISATQMLSNGNDIRFGKNCSGTTPYNYWIESGINTPTTNVWVKIDTIPANGTRTFYMFYNNPSAAASSTIAGVFFGPHSSTDSVATGSAGGATNSQRGFRFTPTEDLLISHFGKREPNGTAREVTLFDFTTQAVISQQTVTGAAAQYNYTPLTNPFWVMNATQYILSLYQGPTDGYYFGNSSQIGQHMTYGDMRYCNSCASTTFPNSILTNYHYGYPDMWYWTKNNFSPAPSYTYDIPTSASSIVASNTAICSGASVSFTANNTTGGLTYSWQPLGVSGATATGSPTASTIYSLITTQPSCNVTYNTPTLAINVNATPVITVSSGSICNGQSYTMTATGAATYVYQGGNAIVSPTTTTTYSVVGTGTNGCMSNPTNVTVSVTPIPNVLAANSPSLICVGGSATLTASGASSYVWSTTATTSAIAVTPTVTTTYTVTGTSNGCSKTVTVTQNVSTCAGLAANTELTSYTEVFPNPNNGTFTLKLSYTSKVTIVDALGKVVFTEQLSAGEHKLNLSTIAKGVYFLKTDAEAIRFMKE
jgi:hypothetical protein